jgi:hypothetical protein
VAPRRMGGVTYDGADGAEIPKASDITYQLITESQPVESVTDLARPDGLLKCPINRLSRGFIAPRGNYGE